MNRKKIPPQEKDMQSGARSSVRGFADEEADSICRLIQADSLEAVNSSLSELGRIDLRLVSSRKELLLWDEIIERYHYLGYTPLPGARVRYFAFAVSRREPGGETKWRLLALLGFNSGAWMVAARDNFIGWTNEQRKRNLRFVLNNARFLILPWVKIDNLASRILSLTVKQVKKHWKEKYGYEPVLLETFVERKRFRGTCYRAANWIHVGETKVHWRLSKKRARPKSVKEMFVYPLSKCFRQILCREN